MENRYEEAKEALTKAKEEFELIGERLGSAQCIEFLGKDAEDCGDYRNAKQMYRQALKVQEAIGLSSEIARCQRRLENLLVRIGTTE